MGIIWLIFAIIYGISVILAYREGVRLGMTIKKGDMPEKIKSPIKIISEHKEQKTQAKEEEEYMKQLTNLLNYDGEVIDDE